MNEAFSIPFSPLAGTAENRWLRLVQVGADDDIVTMDEAAELIDALYKISPCDTGTGGSGGGENAPEEPTEEEFDALSAEALGELCAGQDHWDVQVDLLRSHPNPAAWRVQAGDAEHVSTEIVVETRTETVSLDGADHHDLERPYHAGLRVVGAEVADVRGSTVNFARPVTGRVRLTYTTRFERLTLRVPATPDEHGQAQAEPASVIAFWDRRAAQLELKQPEPDDGVSAAELADLCRGKGKDKTGDCRRTIEHYRKCDCSDTEMPDGPWNWTEEASAPCPEGAAAGSFLGSTRVCDGYGGCPGEEDELNDPEYYKATCCHNPPKPLPRCRKRYRAYSGGAPIEGGADSWRERYGSDVILTAVTPPDGPCGQEITEWKVERQNCCDDVEPLSPDPRNPTEINIPGRSYGIIVLGGKDGVPFHWKTSGGLLIGQTGTTEWTVRRRDIAVYFEAGACPDPAVTVSDGCTTLRMVFQGPDSEPPRLEETDIEAPSDSTFLIGVEPGTGLPPYTLMVTGGLELDSYAPDGRYARIRTPGTFDWCVGSVMFIDACGRQATCTVRNPDTGRWIQVPQASYDRCAPPGAPFPGRVNESGTGNVNTLPNGGYYARVVTTRSRGDGSGAPCGPGNNISNQSWKWSNECLNNTFPPGQYNVSYSDGVCTGVNKTIGGVTKFHYYELTSILWQWVCNNG